MPDASWRPWRGRGACGRGASLERTLRDRTYIRGCAASHQRCPRRSYAGYVRCANSMWGSRFLVGCNSGAFLRPNVHVWFTCSNKAQRCEGDALACWAEKGGGKPTWRTQDLNNDVQETYMNVCEALRRACGNSLPSQERTPRRHNPLCIQYYTSTERFTAPAGHNLARDGLQARSGQEAYKSRTANIQKHPSTRPNSNASEALARARKK